MECEQKPDVDLRPWTDSDFWLLERLMGDPVMTTYLGGPEPPDQIRRRHAQYCQIGSSGKGHMFVIVVGPDQLSAGSVGYWETEWNEHLVWETGWSVLPEFQGQGIATRAAAAAVDHARAAGKHRFLHAFPSVDNDASNAICRKLGFILQKEVEFEAWREPGTLLRFNDWVFDLFAASSENA